MCQGVGQALWSPVLLGARVTVRAEQRGAAHYLGGLTPVPDGRVCRQLEMKLVRWSFTQARGDTRGEA